MLNDVMTLAEASVIWGIKYEGLLKCITAGPLDQPKFHDDEVDKIQDTWLVTRQAMERLFWPMRAITADKAYMLAQLECPGALITNYYETERGFVFSGQWYGGGLPKLEKKAGRVGWYLEEWGNRDKAKWKATEDLFMGSFEDSLGPIYDSIKEKQEIVRKNQLPGVHNPYPESKEHKTIFQKFLDKIGW